MKVPVKTGILSLIFFMDLFSIPASGQTNTIEILTDLGTRYDYAHSIVIQSDDKVVVAGDAWGKPCMIRFDTTGLLDFSFGSDGKVYADWDCGSNPADNDIKVLADGKLILGTSYYSGSGYDFILAKYDIDGTPDNSFGSSGKVIERIGKYGSICNCIAIQSDGKIVAAGTAYIDSIGEYRDFALLRCNPDGSIDNTFGDNGIVTTHIGNMYNSAYSMAIQFDGKIILAGEANDSIFSDFALARYNPDGTPDTSFGDNGIVRTALSETYDFAKSVVLQADQKIIVAGSSQDGLSNYNIALIRYDTDGNSDDSFGTGGVVITDIGNEFGNSVTLQEDNKIVLAGSQTLGTVYHFATLRFNSDGSMDNSFGTDGVITNSFGGGSATGNAIAIGKDGEIIIAGSYNHGNPKYFDFALARLFSSVKLPDISPPVLLSPQDEAINQPTNPAFLWEQVSGATGYNLQVSTSSEFDTCVINETGLVSTGHIVSGLSNNTTYFWRVCATKDYIPGAWSETWFFSTTSVTENSGEITDQLKIYPVPVDDKLFIEGIEEESVTVSILSIEGKIVMQWQGTGIREIDLNDIRNGFYLLKIFNSKTNYTQGLIKF